MEKKLFALPIRIQWLHSVLTVGQAMQSAEDTKVSKVGAVPATSTYCDQSVLSQMVMILKA